MQIEHVDFVSFPTPDIQRARSFSADTFELEIARELGLRRRRFGA